MPDKAVCGSCHASVKSVGKAKKNNKGQWLVTIHPHWKAGEIGGLVCNARVGVTTK